MVEELFRFAIARPPVAPSQTVVLLSAGVAEQRVMEQLRVEWRRETDPAAARQKVGDRLTADDDYIANSVAGRELLAAASDVRALLDRTSAEPNLRTLHEDTKRFLAPVLQDDISVSEWLAGEHGTRLRHQLWLSYFACCLAPRGRSFEREAVVAWLTLLHLLDATDAAALAERAALVGATRVGIPIDFFEDPPPPAPPQPPADPRGEVVHAAQQHLARLAAARTALQGVYLAKMRASHPPTWMPRPRHSVSWRILASSPRGKPCRASSIASIVRRRSSPLESTTWLWLPSTLGIPNRLGGCRRQQLATTRSKIMQRPLVEPVGVSDLKVVRQRLARYEAGEVAHVENVLASEHRDRKHRRLRRMEETIEREQVREQESVRDLQTTERFELQRETQRTLSEELAVKAGASVSGTIGAVTIGVYADFSYQRSQKEADRIASTYAKQVVDKSLSRLVEKVREARRALTIEETEETNEHGFDNRGPDASNITGVYRWLDKYYRAKVFNYGKRLLFEFVVPEPALYQRIIQRAQRMAQEPTKPDPPTIASWEVPPPAGGIGGIIGPKMIKQIPREVVRPLVPTDLTRTNYLRYVGKYRPEGVVPPPPKEVVIAKAFHREFPSDAGTRWAFTLDEFEVPDGYVAAYGQLLIRSLGEGTVDDHFLLVGMLEYFHNPNAQNATHLDHIVGRIPISGAGSASRTFAVNVEVVCQLRDEQFERWQLDTYAAIMTAYQKALSDYEDRMAAMQVARGVTIAGDNPEVNRATEREELKRACLTLWTGLTFDDPVGISHTPPDLPVLEPAVVGARTRMISFFERAMDWSNMTYEFLPYYWGRKQEWLGLAAAESTDPLFRQFLRAGAARVTVPVHPVYVEAVLYYQLTGDLDPAGKISALTGKDPRVDLYNSYLLELTEPGLPTPPGELQPEPEPKIDHTDPTTWLIKVPTTLVWLQDESDLPVFEPTTP
jgi:hypothetical protein